jgi:ADP-heptose:LPS heptosyltransferase
LLTKTVEEPGGELHKIDYFLNIARFVGIDPADTRYEFFVKNEDRASVLKFFESENVTDKDILVALCPGGNWDPKRWPKENFALLGSLISKSAGARIAICGAKKDIGLAGEIASLMSVPPIIACGRTTLGQLGAVFERANLVVANDTGPMHIASAVGADVIALFGPTSARITGPRGRGRSVVISADVSCDVPCYDHTCKDYRCMSAITVEEVFCAAEKILIKKQ